MTNDCENEMCQFGNEKYLFGETSEQVEQENKVITSEIISFRAHNPEATKVLSSVCEIRINSKSSM
jgi:hypothetical protein